MKLKLQDYRHRIMDDLDSGRHISVTRWNDGEWMSLLGRKGKNIDGAVFQEAKPALRRVLESPVHKRHRLCVGPTYYKKSHKLVDKWITDHHPHLFGAEWFSSFWTKQFVYSGAWFRFFDACRRRRPLVFGPEHVREAADKLLDPVEFVETHPTQAIREVEFHSDLLVESEDVNMIVTACGWAGNILVERAGAMGISGVNIGSMLDPFSGRRTRGCWQRLKRLP